MIKNLHLIVTFAILFTTCIYSKTNFPFPQKTVHYKGIYATNADASKIQECFSNWKKGYYIENGDEARIKFIDNYNNGDQTVSEAIGYGMLIFVYMDNTDNKAQSCFDKIWKYYSNRKKTNGIMPWKFNGFTVNPTEGDQNSATDAELDAALALLMAYKQWGSESYLTDAKNLITAIWKSEINSTDYYVKAGDNWDGKQNPSYASTCALELFKSVDSNDWNKVIANEYKLLQSCANETSGLVPNWVMYNNPKQNIGDYDGLFSLDGVRVPWRMALANAWFANLENHSPAAQISGKMTSWAKGVTANDPSKLKGPYMVDGTATTHNWNDSGFRTVPFIGAFTCAGMVDAKYQDWVNAGYTATVNSTDATVYFSKILQVLYLLTMSGNTPNFWDTSTPVHLINKWSAKNFSAKLMANSKVLSVTLPNTWNSAQIQIQSINGKTIYNAYTNSRVLSIPSKNLSKGLLVVQAISESQKLATTILY